MSKHVFLSYSRQNGSMAGRVQTDLERCGCTVWLDRLGLTIGDEWKQEIARQIEGCDHCLMLWSPEAAKSSWVQKEVAMAQAAGKRMGVARIAGGASGMADEWRQLHYVNLLPDYAAGLRELLRWLEMEGTAPPASFCDLLDGGGGGLAAAAADALDAEGMRREWTVRGVSYRGVPVRSSAYGHAWLVMRADAPLVLEAELQVMLKFSGPAARARSIEEVLDYLQTNARPVCLVYVEGPKDDKGGLAIPDERTHVWHDLRELSCDAISRLGRGRRMHYFLEAPGALVFAVAEQLRGLAASSVYNLARAAPGSGARYAEVFHM